MAAESSSRWRCSDREHSTVTWPSTLHLCLGTATWPSTLTSDPSRVQPGVDSHRHTHGVAEGSVGRYSSGFPQRFSCRSDPHQLIAYTCTRPPDSRNTQGARTSSWTHQSGHFRSSHLRLEATTALAAILGGRTGSDPAAPILVTDLGPVIY